MNNFELAGCLQAFQLRIAFNFENTILFDLRAVGRVQGTDAITM